jgi:dTDP-4-dehydrorhamnose reductase
MKLLIIRDQQELAGEICNVVNQREESIIPIPVAWDAIGDSVDISRLVEQQRPDYVLCAVLLPAHSVRTVRKRFRGVVEQIERCCRKHSLPLLFLSTGAVFDGTRAAYSEGDEPHPVTELGKFYLDLENHLARKLHKHIILRTTWLFSGHSENFLTSVIEHASRDVLISVNSAGKGSPTALSDLARVLVAILLQLDSGGDEWGIYHYSGSDPVIGYQFVEAIVACAAQYNEEIVPARLHFEHNGTASGRFYFEPVVLNCRKLLDTFGIQQRSWRLVLATTVRQYFEWAEVENE